MIPAFSLRPASAVRLLALGLAVPSLALAFSSGPLDGLTGAPGEGTCVQCHSTFPLNSGQGSLALGGIGASYTGSQTYTLSLTLSDPVAMRWGFELTALNASGASIGSFVLPAILQQSTTGNRTYVKHRSSGTFPGTPNSHTWQFDWTAPALGAGPVTFYVAGNAANNNNANTGDRIYATSFAFPEFNPVPVAEAPPDASLLGNYPNPFNPLTTIRFSLPARQPVRLEIFTVDGRRVATLAAETLEAGVHEVAWNGLDYSGRPQPSGSYVYILETGGVHDTGRMSLVR